MVPTLRPLRELETPAPPLCVSQYLLLPSALLLTDLLVLGSLLGCFGCFLFVWLIMGVVWFFQTCSETGGSCENPCDAGIYHGTKIYFFLTLLVPWLIFCCCCCCFGAVAAANKSANKEGP